MAIIEYLPADNDKNNIAEVSWRAKLVFIEASQEKLASFKDLAK